MVVSFANFDAYERPVLVLKNAQCSTICILNGVSGTNVELNYNEISTLTFDISDKADGKAVEHYDDVIGMRVIELVDIGQFILFDPEETNNGLYKTKHCVANSLEYEFAFKKISLPKQTYRFWKPFEENDPEDSIMEIIMELMPSWSVGYVSPILANKYRTFEVNNENLYNFIKGTIQQSYGCIFDFDTMNRIVNIRSVSEVPSNTRVMISPDNLAKQIELHENTEKIVTRLDVNGADGVDIRDVNPGGTNSIINLNYFMTTTNFSQELIDKYRAWEKVWADNQKPYYYLSIEYYAEVMRKVTEGTELVTLQNELTALENKRSVIIQSMAMGSASSSDLRHVNNEIASKQAAINQKQSSADSVNSSLEEIMNQMIAIRNQCSFEKYFTADEHRQLDKYIKDDDISESSFVVPSVSGYKDDAVGFSVNGATIKIDGNITKIVNQAGTSIYSTEGGSVKIGNIVEARVLSSTCEIKSDNKFVLSARVGSGKHDGGDFTGGCVTVTGFIGSFTDDCTPDPQASEIKIGSVVNVQSVNGYAYFTQDASEYEKHRISWELYEYGLSVLNRVAYPTYTFNVSSANFLSMDQFELFKQELRLGEKIYLQLDDEKNLEPICIGVRYSYDDPSSLDLVFSDSYASNDSSFTLVDLLSKSVSSGKNLSLSKYVYSSFVDSGASNSVRDFMTSALDVSKNAIISSTGQAMSWDASGLRLRKWADESQSAYDPKQIWMTNNSIVMTKDNWESAEMAIGNFMDENLGECWGIVAPRIVGTILAGESLVIESTKKDNDIAVFRVDGDGCRLYNSEFSVRDKTNTWHITMNPDVGLLIGKMPLYEDNADGTQTVIEENRNFWVDSSGNVRMRGILEAAEGSFRGNVTATSLTIVRNNDGKDTEVSFDSYIDSVVDMKTNDIVADVNASIRDLIDENDGELNIYRGTSAPTNPADNDIWVNTLTGSVYRYDIDSDGNGKWTDITKTSTGMSIRAIDQVDGKVTTYAQAEMPSATTVGDLWIDTDNKNQLYRWDGYVWRLVRDTDIASAIQDSSTAVSVANAASSLAGSIHDGTAGISFASSTVKSLKLNTTDGLKIIGSDGQYFQVKNSAMGFFSSSSTPLLYYSNGNMYLSGIIYASGGSIGGSNGWIIGTDCIYNGGSSSIGSGSGIYMGVNGISVGNAIEMRPDGSFIIRGDSSVSSSSSDNYIFKITPFTKDDGNTIYRLYMKNMEFDKSFVLPSINGGTGGNGRDSIGRLAGIYRSSSATGLSNYSEAINGDIGVVYEAGTSGASISGSYTTSASGSPGYMAVTQSYSATGHRYPDLGTSYFGLSGIQYWNVSGLNAESVSTSYARVGAGETATATAGLFIPMNITVSGATSFSTVNLEFTYIRRPAGCSRDTYGEFERPITIALYKSGSTTPAAETTFSIPSQWVAETGNTARSATVTLDSSSGITTGLYYAVFYSKNTDSLMWIQWNSIGLEGVGAVSESGLYIKSGNYWKSVASSSGTSESVYVLPAATSTTLGGVKIGSNITNASGTISLTSSNITSALGYTPSQAVSVSNRTTSGTRIATLTIGSTSYDLYAPTSTGSSGSGGSTVSISNRLTSGTRIATLTINGSAYDLYAPTSTGTASGDYLPLSGGTLTGNLTIKASTYPTLTLQPTYGSTTRKGVIEGTYEGNVSMQAYTDSTGNTRRILELTSTYSDSSIDDAIQLRTCTSGTWNNSIRVIHTGMTTAGRKTARESLGIICVDSLPSTGTEGYIYFVKA